MLGRGRVVHDNVLMKSGNVEAGRDAGSPRKEGRATCSETRVVTNWQHAVVSLWLWMGSSGVVHDSPWTMWKATTTAIDTADQHDSHETSWNYPARCNMYGASSLSLTVDGISSRNSVGACLLSIAKRQTKGHVCKSGQFVGTASVLQSKAVTGRWI
jgi:hypothetical protein